MIISVVRFYLYCIFSVILFAGTFVAIPRSYNLSSISYANDVVSMQDYQGDRFINTYDATDGEFVDIQAELVDLYTNQDGVSSDLTAGNFS